MKNIQLFGNLGSGGGAARAGRRQGGGEVDPGPVADEQGHAHGNGLGSHRAVRPAGAGGGEVPGEGSKAAIQGRLHGDFVPVKGTEGDGRKTQLRLEVVIDRITYLSPMRRSGEASAEGDGEEQPVRSGRSGR